MQTADDPFALAARMVFLLPRPFQTGFAEEPGIEGAHEKPPLIPDGFQLDFKDAG